MVFTSSLFVFFLPLVWGLTFCLPAKSRRFFLLVASYGFYAAWKPAYLILIAAITCLDFFSGQMIERSVSAKAKRLFFLLSIGANLGILFYFKYLGFFAHELNSLAEALNGARPLTVPAILLPLGISFHTFQSMSYITDVYRGTAPAEKNWIRFALFISWFPQMVAGPIERADTLLRQLNDFPWPRMRQLESGLSLLLWGFAKKLIIADQLAPFVDSQFSAAHPGGSLAALLGVYAYALQIFCDFSGYTDIARGASRLFGIELVENFDRPYLSASIPEFWKRWHMSLSFWFFEYVYFPVARSGVSGAAWLGIFLVFALSGLWHGANWNFLVWGLLNGLLYMLYLLYQRRFEIPEAGWGRALAIFLNFNLVCFCWIFFRAPGLEAAGVYLQRLFSGEATDWAVLLSPFEAGIWGVAAGLALLAAQAKWPVFSHPPETWPRLFLVGEWVFLAAMILMFGSFGSESFIYFQF